MQEQAEKNKDESGFPPLIPRRSVVFTIRYLAKKLLHIEAKGLENIPKEGPAILVCNHTDYLDTIVQLACCKRKLNYLGKKEFLDFKDNIQKLFFKGGFPFENSSPMLKNAAIFLEKNLQLISDYMKAHFIEWGVQPIERGYREKVSSREALEYYRSIEKKLQEVLLKGEILAIFPEGTRTDTGVMGPFKSTAAKLAVQMQLPIIPSGINGAYRLSSLESILAGKTFQTPISYNVGKPILPAEFSQVLTDQQNEGQSEKLEEESASQTPNNEKRMIRLLNARLEKEVYSLTQAPTGGDETQEKGKSRRL